MDAEQTKLEEKVLEGNLANIRSNLDVAILVSTSLGKTAIFQTLKRVQYLMSFCKE